MKKLLLLSTLCMALLTSACSFSDASSPGNYTASSNIMVKVRFSPNDGVQRDIVHEIDSAKSSIDVMSYSFTSKPIAEALLRAQERNVKIRVISDKSQRKEKYTVIYMLRNQQIPVRIDDTVAIAHNKVMIIDNSTLITGSYNFTHSAEVRNAENCLFIKNDPSLIKQYKDNFLHRWSLSKPLEGPTPANVLNNGKHK